MGNAAAARTAAGQGRRVDDLALPSPHRRGREMVHQPTVEGSPPAAALGFALRAPSADPVTGVGGVAAFEARGSRPQHTILRGDVDITESAAAFALSRALPHAHNCAHPVGRRPPDPAVGCARPWDCPISSCHHRRRSSGGHLQQSSGSGARGTAIVLQSQTFSTIASVARRSHDRGT